MGDVDEVNDDKGARNPGSSLLTASAMKTHATLVVGLLLCGAAFWFELRRAEGGNELSWAYVFEWPLLGLFAVYMWWKVLHPEFRLRRRPVKPTLAPEYQGMLAAWQEEVRRIESTRLDEERTPQADQSGGESTPGPT